MIKFFATLLTLVSIDSFAQSHAERLSQTLIKRIEGITCEMEVRDLRGEIKVEMKDKVRFGRGGYLAYPYYLKADFLGPEVETDRRSRSLRLAIMKERTLLADKQMNHTTFGYRRDLEEGEVVAGFGYKDGWELSFDIECYYTLGTGDGYKLYSWDNKVKRGRHRNNHPYADRIMDYPQNKFIDDLERSFNHVQIVE